MRKVYLHGHLGTLFGKEWDLEVNSVSEAIRAIQANKKEFFQYLSDRANEKIKYRVLIGDEDHEDDKELIINHGEKKAFHIIPVPESADDVVRIVAGVVLIAIGVMIGDFSGTFMGMGWNMIGGALVGMGASLAVGGIASMIIGKPDLANLDNDNQTSFLFNNQVNTVRQGGPIPVIYGEVVAGSQLINFFQLSREYNSDGPIFTNENGTVSSPQKTSSSRGTQTFYNPNTIHTLSSIQYDIYLYESGMLEDDLEWIYENS